MTTLEFISKQLTKAKYNLDKQKQRKGVKQAEIDALEEKVKHYEVVLEMLIKELNNNERTT